MKQSEKPAVRVLTRKVLRNLAKEVTPEGYRASRLLQKRSKAQKKLERRVARRKHGRPTNRRAPAPWSKPIDVQQAPGTRPALNFFRRLFRRRAA